MKGIQLIRSRPVLGNQLTGLGGGTAAGKQNLASLFSLVLVCVVKAQKQNKGQKNGRNGRKEKILGENVFRNRTERVTRAKSSTQIGLFFTNTVL